MKIEVSGFRQDGLVCSGKREFFSHSALDALELDQIFVIFCHFRGEMIDWFSPENVHAKLCASISDSLEVIYSFRPIQKCIVLSMLRRC